MFGAILEGSLLQIDAGDINSCTAGDIRAKFIIVSSEVKNGLSLIGQVAAKENDQKVILDAYKTNLNYSISLIHEDIFSAEELLTFEENEKNSELHWTKFYLILCSLLFALFSHDFTSIPQRFLLCFGAFMMLLISGGYYFTVGGSVLSSIIFPIILIIVLYKIGKNIDTNPKAKMD